MAPVVTPELQDLLEQIRSHRLDLDSGLALIVDRAAELTSASGAALALGPPHGCFCRASFGDAPEVGVPIHPDSGLTGDCVRQHRTVCCDDAHNDSRLDPAVCRQLNLRSAVLVPLFAGPAWQDFAGVLEVSSSRTHAFSREHVSRLQELAEIASILAFREVSLPFYPGNGDLQAPAAPPAAAPAGPRFPRFSAGTLRRRLADLRAIRWIIAAALLVVIGGALLFSGRAAQRPQPPQPRPASAASPTPVAASLVSAPVASDRPAEPSPAAAAAPAPTPALRTKNASAPLKPSAVRTPARLAAPLAPDSFTTRERPQPPSSENAARKVPDPPVIAANLAQHSTNVVFLTLPTLAGKPLSPTRRSEGVSGGALIYKVMPSYPALARTGSLEGEIVLSAVVATDGSVKSVRILSGNPVLAGAAADAVSKWRYEPFKLNGVPTETETTVKVRFTRSN
ncbi:MAG TPA: TonB family protein [Terriglobales bacterium]|nr:TonB family protein [Terriglobales bacterium]